MLSKLPNQIPVTFDIKVKDLSVKEAGRVFLIFPTDKIIIDLSRNEKGDFYGKQEGETKDIIYLPEGREIILKAVTEKNKELYTGEVNLLVKQKIKETIKVAKTTDEEVASKIKKYEQKVVQVQFSLPTLPITSTTTRIPIVIRQDLSAKQFEDALEKHYQKQPVLDDYAECCYEMDLVKGKELFESNCTQCHQVHKKVVGPDLAHVERRWRKRQNLIEFIKYPEKMITQEAQAEGGRASWLYEEYGQMMPNHNHLSDGDISSILYYIEKESENYSYSDFLED